MGLKIYACLLWFRLDYQASSTSTQKCAKGAGNKATAAKKSGKQHNTLPFWGNDATMNLNPLILANIQSSSYFKGTSMDRYSNGFYDAYIYILIFL